jgi:hypothetical protein
MEEIDLHGLHSTLLDRSFFGRDEFSVTYGMIVVSSLGRQQSTKIRRQLRLSLTKSLSPSATSIKSWHASTRFSFCSAIKTFGITRAKFPGFQISDHYLPHCILADVRIIRYQPK